MQGNINIDREHFLIYGPRHIDDSTAFSEVKENLHKIPCVVKCVAAGKYN
jgi:hypothetical protein